MVRSWQGSPFDVFNPIQCVRHSLSHIVWEFTRACQQCCVVVETVQKSLYHTAAVYGSLQAGCAVVIVMVPFLFVQPRILARFGWFRASAAASLPHVCSNEVSK